MNGKVGPSNLADGTQNEIRLGRAGEQVVTLLHGTYAEQGLRGNSYVISTPAAGVTVPIYTNAVQQFVLYNPAGSGINIVLLKAYIGYVSGTNVAGHFCYAGTVSQGVPTSSTQALTQSSLLKAPNPLISGAGSKGLYYSPATPAVALVAANYIRPFGVSQVVQAATATNAPWTAVDDIDGGIIIPPLGIVVIAANVAAASVSTIGCLVEEVPV